MEAEMHRHEGRRLVSTSELSLAMVGPANERLGDTDTMNAKSNVGLLGG